MYGGWLVVILLFYVLWRLYRLTREIRDVRGQLRQLSALLRPTIEGEAAPVATQPVTVPTPSQTPRPPAPSQATVAAVSAPLVPSPPVTPAPPLPPVPPAILPSRPIGWSGNFESLIGANWLSKLGVIALALSAAFFLRYAFESGWISPTMRVSIGVISAALLLMLGQYLLARPRYNAYAQILMSGGIIILFLSIYAAFNFYQLISYFPAFVLLAITALAVSALAVSNDTQAVALLCLAGAFATPLLIHEEGGASGSGIIKLYGYLAVLNMWAILLVKKRPWYSLLALALIFTWILFFAVGPRWHPNWWQLQLFALLFLAFSCYSGLTSAQAQGKTSAGLEQMGIAMVVLGFLAFLVGSAIVLSGHILFGLPALVMACLLVAGLAVLLSLAMPTMDYLDTPARQLFRYLSAIVLVVVVVATKAYVSWIPREQALTAFLFSTIVYLLFLGAAISIVRQQDGEEPATVLLVANAFTHAVLVGTTLGGLPQGKIFEVLWLPFAGWLGLAALWRAGEGEERSTFRIVAMIIAQAMSALGLFRAIEARKLENPWPWVWAVTALFLLISATWLTIRRSLLIPRFRADVMAAFGNAAIFFGLLAYLVGMSSFQGFVVLCGFALAMAAYHALVGGIVLRRPEDDALIRFIYLGIALTFVTIAIPLQLKTSYITLAWAAEGAVLVWTGLTARERRFRYYGAIVLALAGGKALLLDLPSRYYAERAFINPTMLSGASVIAAAYISAWLLWRKRELIASDERWLIPIWVVTANVFTLIFVSIELWRSVAVVGRSSAQQLALSIFWSIYALIALTIGIWHRARPVRLFAIGLLYLSIIKVFLFDLSFLEQAYRIISFFALGLVLLLVSLLYTRFEERLK